MKERSAWWRGVNSGIKTGWEERQTEPVGYISLHYRSAAACQVQDARPRERCVILEQRLPANYQPQQHTGIKTQPPVSAELICLITSL